MAFLRRTIRYFPTFLIGVTVGAVVVTILGYHYKLRRTDVTSLDVRQNRDLAVDSDYGALEAFLSENMKLTNRDLPVNSGYSTLEEFLSENMKLANYSGQGTKYIVYDCSKARKVQCNGWSDRIAGIMTTFIISILVKRHFLINFDTPCFLEDYVIPAHFDWRYNSSILLNRTSSFQDLQNKNHRKIDKYMFRGDDFNTYFKNDVTFLLFNWDFIIDLRKRPNIGYDIPWITKYHQADIYKHIFNFLFKLSPVSVRALNHQYRNQRKRNKIACAHIRVGRNPNMPRDGKRLEMPLDILWKYFDMLNKDEYDLFVASDTDSIKSLAKKRYPNRMIDTPGEITHIDQPNKNDAREGFLKQLLEFYILVGCDTLIISDSGFSMLAAFIRNIDYGLYCWQGRDLIPCSRYTMADIFPIGKFGKRPWDKI